MVNHDLSQSSHDAFRLTKTIYKSEIPTGVVVNVIPDSKYLRHDNMFLRHTGTHIKASEHKLWRASLNMKIDPL